MFIQQIPGWNTGARLRNSEMDINAEGYIRFSEEVQFFLDEAGDEYSLETIDLISDKWELVPICPHCNGTGLLSVEKVVTKKGKKQ